MARYQVILAYDGTRFHGSQRQRSVRTVQGVVEQALRELEWDQETALFAGRTDAGVHASGQVVAFDLDWHHPDVDLRNALNALLPEDVAARQVLTCQDDFHPRYDALSRKYRYRVFIDPVRDPLRERYAWRLWPAPKLDRLNAAATAVVGQRDFASFGSPMRPKGSTTRQVFAAGWRGAGDVLEFEITANAFLYHMVRRLVFAQVAVGQGKTDMQQYQHHLSDAQPPQIQGLAPAWGLSLVEVRYPPEVVSENNDLADRREEESYAEI